MSQDETAVNQAAVQDVAAESAPVETSPVDGANAQVTDPNDDNFFDDVDAQVAEGNQEAVADDTAEAAPEETPGQPRGEDGKFIKKDEQPEEKPLAPKSQNRFQELANKNRDYEQKLADPNFLQEQLQRLQLQQSQLATEQELLNEINPETGDYYTPQEVERIAFQQTREQQMQSVAQQRYALEVQQNQTVLASEAEKALADFPMFNAESKDYNPTLAAQADQLLANSLIVQDGVIVGATTSPYQIYKTIADATKANAPVYQAQAQKATEKMLANADVAPGASQATKTKVDPMMAAFDEEASIL